MTEMPFVMYGYEVMMHIGRWTAETPGAAATVMLSPRALPPSGGIQIRPPADTNCGDWRDIRNAAEGKASGCQRATVPPAGYK